MAYDALAHNDPLRWFLLAYSNKPNQLSLYASGMGDLEELCSHLTPERVQYGVFREKNKDKALYVAVSYIPNTVSGVKRARALVHAKAVSTQFKAHQIMNVSNAEQITVPALRSALRLPPRQSQSTSDDTASPGQNVPPSFSASRKPPPRIRASMFTSPHSRDTPTALAHVSTSSTPTPSSPSGLHFPSVSASQLSSPTFGDGASKDVMATPSAKSQPSLTNIATESTVSLSFLPSSTPQSPFAIFPSPKKGQINDVQTPQSPQSPHHSSWIAKQDSPLPPPPPEKPQPLEETRSSESEQPLEEMWHFEEPQLEPQPISEHELDNSDKRPESPLIGLIPDSRSIRSQHSSPRAPSPSPPAPPKYQENFHDRSRSRSPERRADLPVDGLPRPSLSSPLSIQLNSPSHTAAQEEALGWRSKWAAEPVQADIPAEKNHRTEEQRDFPEAPAPPSTRSRFQARAVSEEEAGQVDGGSSRSKWSTQAAARDFSPEPERTASPTLQRTRSRFHSRGVAEAVGVNEEERRLSMLDDERRRRAAIRAKQEKEAREEEEAREREFKERKEREKKRRMEIAKKSEERRVEYQRVQEEAQRRQQEEKQRKEEETQRRRKHIQKRFDKQKDHGVDLLSGFITLESSGNWKRRYFQLSTEDWVFFKNDTEVTHPMHTIDLSRVRALREWHEGYDELEAIPHSFAVELENDEPGLFFTDAAEDKEVLLGLLAQAAGL